MLANVTCGALLYLTLDFLTVQVEVFEQASGDVVFIFLQWQIAGRHQPRGLAEEGSCWLIERQEAGKESDGRRKVIKPNI